MTGREAIFQRRIRPLAPIPTGVAANLSKMQRFSAMLFDVYGTLIISRAGDIGLNRRPLEKMADWRGLLKRYAIECTPQSLLDALNRAIGKAHRIEWRRGIDFPEVDILRIWQKVLGLNDIQWLRDFALEVELMLNPVYPMPGCQDLLLACKNRGLPMGIISNAQFYTVLVLQWLLGSSLEQQGFDRQLLFFSWQAGHAKPSAVMFERAKAVLSDMGIPAAHVLYVGNDMRNDILPASSVGFKTALFAGDRRSLRLRESDDCCRKLSPDLIITDLRQLNAGTIHPLE
jgi:putative hydrolase of the HAD superfamily